ncbi:MAG: hypothetical protein M3Z75_09545 [Actinomycetota bacterium]|nr:hypothetical protein [Actinomycetota bacterium]
MDARGERPGRCRHGHTTATRPEPGRPKNTYIREDQILPHRAAVAIPFADGSRPGGSGTMQVTAPADTADLIDQLRAAQVVPTYDPDTRTLRTSGADTAAVAVGKPADR